MISLHDVSLGDKKEINIFQICSIEETSGDNDIVHIRMSNGDDHKTNKKRADHLIERINKISQKLGFG